MSRAPDTLVQPVRAVGRRIVQEGHLSRKDLESPRHASATDVSSILAAPGVCFAEPTGGRLSYLVRVGRRRVDGREQLAVVLESVATGARTTLPGLDGLEAFLRSQLEAGSGADRDQPSDPRAGTDPES